jgi:hypothetical protein
MCANTLNRNVVYTCWSIVELIDGFQEGERKSCSSSQTFLSTYRGTVIAPKRGLGESEAEEVEVYKEKREADLHVERQFQACETSLGKFRNSVLATALERWEACCADPYCCNRILWYVFMHS